MAVLTTLIDLKALLLPSIKREGPRIPSSSAGESASPVNFAAADEEAALSPEDRQLARLVWDGELTRRPASDPRRQSADSDPNKFALSAVAPRAS
jgi:hypothetical protein